MRWGGGGGGGGGSGGGGGGGEGVIHGFDSSLFIRSTALNRKYTYSYKLFDSRLLSLVLFQKQSIYDSLAILSILDPEM